MRKIILAALALFIAGCLIVTSAVAATTWKYIKLADRINSILADIDAGPSVIAVKVISLDTGQTVFERNSRRPMIPASNTKLFTTAAALYYLGADFTIRTSFYFVGDLSKNGVLDGDLVIYGRGDPNISGRFTDGPTVIYEQVVDALKARGLRRINGDIVGDDSYFDSSYYGPWSPGDSHKWYAARVSALSFNDNCIDICVTPGDTPGEKPTVIHSPDSSYARVLNRARTTSRRNNSVWAAPGGNGSDVQVRGRIWTGNKEETLNFPVEAPSLYAATVFKDVLEEKGVPVYGRVRESNDEIGTAVPSGATPEVEYESFPLSEMIKVVNKRSQNLHAELLLKQVGLHVGRGGSFEGGTRAVHDFTRLIEIPSDAVRLHDGSGLCRSNRVTVDAIVRLLKYMDSSPWGKVYRESLAVSGVDEAVGSLSAVVPDGSIMGKTGSLTGVFAFSGYANGKTERFAFSIIVNGFENGSHPFKQARDRICKELVKS